MLPSTIAAQVVPPPPVNSATLITRLDSAMSAGLARDRIVGGAYVLVLDGRVVASRGFGLADESGRQVHPDSTVFGLASNDAPASAAYATPHDMGLLMQHLLRPGSAEDSAVASSLFSRRFTNHPALPGMTLGFRESADGTGIFEQGGDWQDYSNSLYLDRQSATGLFAVFSSGEGGRTAPELWSLVREELPARPNGYTFTQRASGADGAGRCAKVHGTYRDTRMSRHTLAKLGVLTGDVREISVGLSPTGITLGGRTYHEMGGGVFQSDSGRTVAFRCGHPAEPASHLFFGRSPASSYRRVAAGETRAVQGGLLIVALLATIAAVITDVKRRRITKDVVDTVARGLRIVSGFAAALLFLGMILLLVTASPWEFQYGLPASIVTLASVGRFIAAGAGIALIVTLTALVRPRAASGILEAMLAIPIVLLVVLMVQWNLLFP